MNEVPEDQLGVQIYFGGKVELGCVGVILHNCPISPVFNGDSLAPAFKLTIAQAQEVGMQLIYMARCASAHEQAIRRLIAESEDERCDFVDEPDKRRCIMKRGHACDHHTAISRDD